MSDRPAPDDDAIRTWVVDIEGPLGDLRRSLECLLAITTRRGPPLDPDTLAWLVYQVHDNAAEVRTHWAELWKLTFGRDPDKPVELER